MIEYQSRFNDRSLEFITIVVACTTIQCNSNVRSLVTTKQNVDVDVDAAKRRRRFGLKAIIKEYELLRLTIKLGLKGRII